MHTDATGRTRISTNALIAWAVAFAVIFVVAISMVASSGNPDPTDVAPGEQSLVTSVVNASMIVFREGLEAVLIFAAITASFLGARQHYRRPVLLGVAAAFVVTVLTWFLMTGVVQSLPFSDDVLLAITGLVAVAVLLLVMNWFFHKVYWTDHIKELNSKKRDLVRASEQGERVQFWGFFALGFSAVYREGFEVVLFLQNLNIVAGSAAVFWGVMIGLTGTAAVGFLTFVAHHKLPYKRMLVLTGVLLGVVLVVMIGGSARTLQALGILSTTPLPFSTPDWWARWFEIVPTYETVAIQILAAGFVLGSYYAAEWWAKEKRRRAKLEAAAAGPAPVSGALAATAALPELARRSPAVAGSHAAQREVERVHRGETRPETLCGHDATTLCASDATRATPAFTAALAPVPTLAQHTAEAEAGTAPAATPAPAPAPVPVTTAPAFTPRPLFADREPATPLVDADAVPSIAKRAPLFGDRAPLLPPR